MELTELKEQLSFIQTQIITYEKQIDIFKHQEKMICKLIYDKCKHNWIRKIDSGPYPEKWFECENCNLTKK